MGEGAGLMTQAGVGDQGARRIRFSELHPEVHFTNPLNDPDGLYGAVWGEGGSKRQVRKACEKLLLDELETIFRVLSHNDSRCLSLSRASRRALPVRSAARKGSPAVRPNRGSPSEIPVTPRMPRSAVAGVSLPGPPLAG